MITSRSGDLVDAAFVEIDSLVEPPEVPVGGLESGDAPDAGGCCV